MFRNPERDRMYREIAELVADLRMTLRTAPGLIQLMPLLMEAKGKGTAGGAIAEALGAVAQKAMEPPAPPAASADERPAVTGNFNTR